MKSPNIASPDQHLVIYFQVHQPKRLKAFQFFDIGSHPSYFDDKSNAEILKRIGKCSRIPEVYFQGMRHDFRDTRLIGYDHWYSRTNCL